MKKVPLSDGSGRWFDIESCKFWKESVDPREQDLRDRCGPEGEVLFLTRNGTFILHRWHWSNPDSYLPIDMQKGAAWLISNGYQDELAKLDLKAEERELEV